MRSLLLILGLLFMCPFNADAQAPKAAPADHLTSRGRMMLTGNFSFALSSNQNARWGTQANPGVTYFLRERIGLGAFASLGYQDRNVGTELSAGGGVQALFDVRLTESVSWFINPWLSYNWARQERLTMFLLPDGMNTSIGTVEDQWRYVQFGVFLPFVFKLNAHLGIGIGPFATVNAYQRQDYSLASNGSSSGPEPAFVGTKPGLFDAGPGRAGIETGLMSTIAASF